MRFPSWVKFFAVFMFVTFAWVSLSENFVHHHHSATEEQDCAYCQFHKNFSNSDISTAPLHLIPLFIAFFVVLIYSSHEFKVVPTQYPSRAPPVFL